MGSIKRKHIKTILFRELLNVLETLHLKDILRRRVEDSTPIFKETLDIDTTKKSILVLPNIPWSYRWQRPQQIFSRLANKGYNIFYVSPVTSEKEYLSQISNGIYEVHLKTEESANVLRDFHLNEENAGQFLSSFNRLTKEYQKKDSLLFVLHPVWGILSKKIEGCTHIYDLMDLYSGFPDSKEELVIAEEELMKKSDIVLATAQNLYEYAKKLNDNVYIVRNGSDYEKFSVLKENGKLDSLKNKPIIGYFGAITEWLDFDLMEYVVKENKDKYFVFIGSINTKKARKLYKYKNVFFLGEVSHSELPGYLAYFDVCTIPFILNDLIKSTDPVKFYEYIASGKPVVSVKLPELEKYSDICYLSDSKEEFNENILKAIQENDEDLKLKRARAARENSWDTRVDEVNKIITAILPRHTR